MPLWAVLALGAGTLQTARNAISRSFAFQLSPALNTWARFAFNLPFSGSLFLVLYLWHGAPALPATFFAGCLVTAIAQLLGNVTLVAAFRRGNFAQAIALHKLEVAFAALIGALLFAEHPTASGWLGVAACTAGVLAINLGRLRGPAGWRRAVHLDAGTVLAIASGLLWASASFALKETNTVFALANPRVGDGRFEAAANTLFHTTWIEVALLTAWLRFAEPGALAAVAVHGRRMAALGASAFGGSICWYWAYSLTLVAYVKAVGQFEAVVAVVLSLTVWHEREVLRQIPGVALILLGIGLVLLG
ncbi:MAG TPA: EamA family transporter [Candidatus Dormibacteraeota bacterium]|nr:EamA family transporter [Candidatus Dormibacteraeota bacterium]